MDKICPNMSNIAVGNFVLSTDEVFVFNTNRAFLYKIDIEGFKKFQQKINLCPVGVEATTPTIYGL